MIKNYAIIRGPDAAADGRAAGTRRPFIALKAFKTIIMGQKSCIAGFNCFQVGLTSNLVRGCRTGLMILEVREFSLKQLCIVILHFKYLSIYQYSDSLLYFFVFFILVMIKNKKDTKKMVVFITFSTLFPTENSELGYTAYSTKENRTSVKKMCT